MKQLIEISSKNVVFESEEVVYFGGPWGDTESFEWITAPKTRLVELTKTKQIEAIKVAFVTACYTGFKCSNGITMDSNVDAITKLSAGLDLNLKLANKTMQIRDFSNVTHSVKIKIVEKMVLDLSTNYQDLWLNKNAKVDTINSLSTISEIEAIAF